MVRRLFSVIGLETRGLHEAAYLLAVLAFISQILALVRDRLLAASFGAGSTLDIYYAAFRIPDFLFATVASLLSLYALLPILSRLEGESSSLMLSFMRRILLVFFVGMGIVATVMYFFAPELIVALIPGIAKNGSYPELLLLTRILLLQPILLGASNILANLTQLRHRFLLYSLSPLLYNLGIIFGVVVLYPLMGIVGLGWGVVIGAALHFLMQVPFFTLESVREPLPFSRVLKSLWEVLVLSIPRTATLAAGQISLLVLIGFASLLASGSISVFSFAFNLQAVPLTIIGVSYSVAAFPTLSRLIASGNRQEFVRQVEGALRHIMFWSIPATVLVIVLRAQLVRLILGAGAFSWSATRLTAAALALFILSLLAQSAMLVLARAYYAAGVTLKPFLLAAVSVAVSITSAFILMTLFSEHLLVRRFFESLLRVEDSGDTVVLMLALGYALGPIVQFVLGLFFFSRDFKLPLRDFNRLFFQSLTGAVCGGIGAYVTLALIGAFVNINKVVGIFLQGFFAGVVGVGAVVIVLYLLHNRELAETAEAFRRKVVRPVVLEPTDIASS